MTGRLVCRNAAYHQQSTALAIAPTLIAQKKLNLCQARMHVLQSDVHAELLSCSTAVPQQLQSLQAAMEVRAPDHVDMSLADVSSLLVQMCHPDQSQRISAAAVAETAWLKEAAAKPLKECPIAL